MVNPYGEFLCRIPMLTCYAEFRLCIHMMDSDADSYGDSDGDAYGDSYGDAYGDAYDDAYADC